MNLNGINPKALAHQLNVKGVKTGIRRFVNFGKQLNFYYFWEKRWFFISVLVGASLLSLDQPE